MAIWRLAGAPAASVPFLSHDLKPVTAEQAKQVSEHITNLNSESYTVRKKAFEQLSVLGGLQETALRQALAARPALESQRRLEQLLDNLHGGPGSGEPLRLVRALAVLEHAGTPEARELLERLSHGVAGALLTDQAASACQRLRLRTRD